MSSTKKDRKFQSHSGKMIPSEAVPEQLGSSRFAAIVAEALRKEFGGTNAGVKIVAGFTHANERAVKNWFSAKNGPGGAHLVSLMRHSEEVLETILILADRRNLLAAKKLADARQKLEQMLKLIEEL